MKTKDILEKNDLKFSNEIHKEDILLYEENTPTKKIRFPNIFSNLHNEKATSPNIDKKIE